ncbi:hypothetical protein [Encephalitozoon cuniculi GB-M1]|uniref:Uncharacterized protein n=2 Tax=Encephalitozoon cuniculi TaxID=6035 RepID=Q8SUW2_ENCCU|nr:uncharacterized protein ECU07_1490 [Encephalitozoon cuniculi GB-M1]AGE95851.1 hypothetical protein ECU07_1490 [Encephalitozoon cuniculi]KMV65873.1 hypothetical protein M970_071470 [Encephalitozoon cuniculi EcunIII-L]UYI27312.1 hypothetical protein J0A71_05g11730 [Encephalitozoon cuniculi]CAD25681.1 hypothetical protein [Encephalitozoon cuniculi GB-M1]
MGSKRFVEYLSASVANLSSMVLSMSSGSRAPAEEESAVPLSSINMSEKMQDSERLGGSHSSGDETVVLKRSDHERLCEELESSMAMIEELKRKEREHGRMLKNYDTTLAYVLERNEKEKALLESTIMSEEIERLRSNEYRLKTYIQALKRDLFASEDKMESLRRANNEKIEALSEQAEEIKRMYEEQKRKASCLSNKVAGLESALRVRCEEMVEVVEYCKYLLRWGH